MRTLLRPGLPALILFASAGFTSAAPSLYSFSGQINSWRHDDAGALAAQGLNVGTPVSLQFVVDFDRPGHFLLHNGQILPPEPDPPLGNVSYGRFYSAWVGGTRLEEVEGGFFNGPEDVQETFLSYNESGAGLATGRLLGGSLDSGVGVFRSSPRLEGGIPVWVDDWAVQDWEVGTVVQGYWTANDALGATSLAWGTLRLDSITAVPEPSALALTALGAAAGVLWIGRRTPRLAGSSPQSGTPAGGTKAPG